MDNTQRHPHPLLPHPTSFLLVGDHFLSPASDTRLKPGTLCIVTGKPGIPIIQFTTTTDKEIVYSHPFSTKVEFAPTLRRASITGLPARPDTFDANVMIIAPIVIRKHVGIIFNTVSAVDESLHEPLLNAVLVPTKVEDNGLVQVVYFGEAIWVCEEDPSHHFNREVAEQNAYMCPNCEGHNIPPLLYQMAG